MQVKSPVLFIVFNRPDVTKKTWEAIKAAQPTKLYIVADGPREDRPTDKKLCLEVRNIVSEKITWPCEVVKDFRDVNLGCKYGVSSAITWLFKNEERGIILEDDCLPSPTFFHFCDELLEKYKDQQNVMQISGSNYLLTQENAKELSYYMTTINDIWGWATWRRSWNKYSLTMDGYEEFKKEKLLEKYFKNSKISSWINEYLESCNLPESKVWSTQWVYYLIRNQGYTLAPSMNLVQNIGMQGPGTNNTDSFDEYQHIKSIDIGKSEIVHPDKLIVRYDLDKVRFKLINRTDPAASPWIRFRRKMSKLKKAILT
jgi:hypothetical protein